MSKLKNVYIEKAIKPVKMGAPRKINNSQELADYFDVYRQWTKDNAFEVETSTKNGIVALKKQRPLTILGFCNLLGISVQTWHRWRNDREDLCEVIYKIEEYCKQNKFDGASAGVFNANIISRDLGLADKQEVKAKVSVKKTMSEFYADAEKHKINSDK